MKTQTANTLGEFVEASHLNEQLIRNTVRQFGGWESFKECAHDVASHGIDGGFNGFIYTADTNAFARRNRALIAEMARQQAEDFSTPVVEMIQNFGCFRHDKPTDEEIGKCLWGGVPADKADAGIYNALAWYAGEEVCRSFCDLAEATA
jgi:hypothetical protein